MKLKSGMIAMAVLALAFVGVADADMHKDVQVKSSNVHKAVGNVLLMTSNAIQVATANGKIAEFAITDESDVDERINKGDRIEVWYREDGTESKSVIRSSSTMDTRMEQGPDLDMIEGEILFENPAGIHLVTSRGEIVELEVGANSDLDERADEGDYVKVWFLDTEAGSKSVVKTSRSMHSDAK